MMDLVEHEEVERMERVDAWRPETPLKPNHPMFRSGALTVLTVPLTVLTGEGILVRDGVTVVSCEAGASLI